MIEGTIPARTVALIRSTALRVGVTPIELNHIPGLADAALADAAQRVPTTALWRMWELIGAAAGPTAGLLATERAHHGGLHVWDYLFTSRATLAESLRTAFELRAVVTDPIVRWEVHEDGGLLTVRTLPIEPDLVLAPTEEFVLSMMLRRAREATRQHLVPVRVSFSHRAAHRYDHLVDEFGTRAIDFGAPHSQLVFLDAGALPTGADPHLGDLLRHYAELTITTARRTPDWRERLCTAMGDALLDGELELAAVARRMATSPRTLQRRLEEQGTSWRAEVEDIRHQRAVELLRDTTLPVQSVAARLGYDDARSLRRAFQRWTGLSPDTFRRLSATVPN